MGLWQSYTSINPRTRALLGLGVIAWAGIGLYVSDAAEEKFGFTPSEEEKRRIAEALPRVSVVEPAENPVGKRAGSGSSSTSL